MQNQRDLFCMGLWRVFSCPPSGESVEVLQDFGDISGVNSQQLELPNEGVAFNFLALFKHQWRVGY